MGSKEELPRFFTLQRGKEVIGHSDTLRVTEVLDLQESVSLRNCSKCSVTDPIIHPCTGILKANL